MDIKVNFLVLNIGELFLSNCTKMKVYASFSSNNVTFFIYFICL